MPFFQGATDFEINGGSFQDMRDQYNTNRNESFNINGNNNTTDFAPNYSRTDNRIYDSRSMNMQEFMPPGRNHVVHPQNHAPAMSYEQLYQLQILELQRANLQLQLAASAAASQPHRLGNTNSIPQISERPYDTSGNIGNFLPANGGLNPEVPPNFQSTGRPQQQHFHNPPQLFLPHISPPPNFPSFPPFPHQPAPVLQQHPPSPRPEAFHGSPQQPSSPDHALPGLGAIGAIQQRFERLAQQAPASPAQPPVPQASPPVGTAPSPPPTSTIHPPPTQGMPQGSYHTPNLVQSSPMPAPAVGVSPTTAPPPVRPTTASSSSSSSSSSSDSSKEGAGPFSATPNSSTPATSAVAALATPVANIAVSHQATPIIAPQPLVAQTVNTGPSPLVTQVMGTSPPSTTQPINVVPTATNPPAPSTGPAGLLTLQNTVAAPSMHANFTMTPVPVPAISPLGAPSTGAISSVAVRPLLSFPIPTQTSPSPTSGASAIGSITFEKKKRQSWLGRKFNFKKKSKD